MQRLKIFILIAAISSAVYVNSLSNSFHFDDQHYIVTNPYITNLSYIPSFFKSTRYSSFELGFTSHYRPLLVMSYTLNYAMGRLNPAGYHVVNLLFHVGSAFMVYLILEVLLKSSGDTILNSRQLSMVSPELAAALIFAVHPFNSEVVNYITARSSVMCAFFYLLSFYCWIRYRHVADSSNRVAGSPATFYPQPATYYTASLLVFSLAMLTKEIAITLPVMLFLYDLYFLKTRRTYLVYIPYILLVIIPYLLMRIYSFGRVMGGEPGAFYVNLMTQPKVQLKYLQLLLLPVGLTIEHTMSSVLELYDPTFILPALLLLLIAVAAYDLFRRGGEWRVFSFFIVWFFMTLLPTTIIPLNAILQENRGYLAGIGALFFAGILITRLPNRALVPFLVGVISLCSLATIQRNKAWKDEYTLWRDAVNKAPYSARAHDNLGLAYINRGEYEHAIDEFNKTIEIQPRYYLAFYNAGVVYQMQNRRDPAISSYEACLRINPQYFRAYYNLGILYKKEGKLDKAILAYEKAIVLDPRHPFVYNNLGVALTEKGDMVKAESVFKRAIGLDPEFVKAWFNLGNLYYRTERYDLAAEAYRTVLKLQPDYKEAERMLNAAHGAE